jgi:hypothetical protein
MLEQSILLKMIRKAFIHSDCCPIQILDDHYFL